MINHYYQLVVYYLTNKIQNFMQYSATYGVGPSSFATPIDYGVGSSVHPRCMEDMGTPSYYTSSWLLFTFRYEHVGNMMSSYAEYSYHGVTDDDEIRAHTPTPVENDTASWWVETWFAEEIGGFQLGVVSMAPTQAWCGRTNLNYTSSNTQVLSQGLQSYFKQCNPLVCRVTSDKPPKAGSNKVPRTKASPEIQLPSYFTSQAFILQEFPKVA
jgi:hypothetical protein